MTKDAQEYRVAIHWLMLRDGTIRMGHEAPCVQLVADVWQVSCRDVLRDVAVARQEHKQRCEGRIVTR